ncbi:GNAT family N-acetyltransferase [Sphingomonas turrisvirgatae]|uniref:GNAT family N-acetyltransferase n=1 Tax=Sphingomonas turrisvirgatae TaxID=1888892 RepID=A0A1E3LTI0_9SPHN|nr:N-acetyltransferase [Sphingomonas turrisvirgatae]ODP37056.1 GNAT family N-acetyltransferase [Sphingomonas turrisvirgatae]
MFDLVPLAQVPADAVESLLDAAFGSDRHQRTAYRVRLGMAPVPELSFAALERGELVGSIQCWPVALHRDGDTAMPLVMVGPVAVAPQRQNVGIGRALMWRSIEAAPGGTGLMLIGDPEYYAQFGFDAAATRQWRLPGPFEPHRLLARGSAPDAPGIVGPRS